jgi:hypothetical protein
MSGNYTNTWQMPAIGGGMVAAGQNTISLSSLNGPTISGLFYRNPNYRRYEMIESNEDIIALSVAWKRLRDNRETVPVYVNTLLSPELYNAESPADRERANQIRDYFSKKIMLWTLKEIRLSHYRQDLNELIKGDGKKITDMMLPIAFRLPEFYEYDVEFDKFKQDVTLELKHFDAGTHQKSTALKPINCFYRSNKRVKQFEYWFKDGYGNANMIAIEPKNPLKHIWDNMFTNEHLRIEGTYYPKKYDELQYYQLLNWSLV